MRGPLIGLVLGLMASPVVAQTQGTPDGTWEGNLAIVRGPGLSAPKYSTIGIRLVIAGSNAQVFVRDKTGVFSEVKPGRFRVLHQMANAVIAAIDSGRDSDGTWVETWDFAVTLKAADTLGTNFYRVVNNIDVPSTVADSKFAVGAAGDLSRVK